MKDRRKIDDPDLIAERNSIWNSVVGKRIASLDSTIIGDDGIKITLEDGSTIEVAYSGDEGTTWINGFDMNPWRDLDGKGLLWKDPLTGKYHL